jgi:hypothetical protein
MNDRKGGPDRGLIGVKRIQVTGPRKLVLIQESLRRTLVSGGMGYVRLILTRERLRDTGPEAAERERETRWKCICSVSSPVFRRENQIDTRQQV